MLQHMENKKDSKLGKRHHGLLGKFIRLDKDAKTRYRKENEFDATKPSVLLVLTISYVAVVFFLIIGIPWQGSEPEPIPPEDLPVAIPVFILLYILIIGGLFLRDKLKKRK